MRSIPRIQTKVIGGRAGPRSWGSTGGRGAAGAGRSQSPGTSVAELPAAMYPWLSHNIPWCQLKPIFCRLPSTSLVACSQGSCSDYS